jgi:hypothetical protein
MLIGEGRDAVIGAMDSRTTFSARGVLSFKYTDAQTNAVHFPVWRYKSDKNSKTMLARFVLPTGRRSQPGACRAERRPF